jgi:hypothetical protein
MHQVKIRALNNWFQHDLTWTGQRSELGVGRLVLQGVGYWQHGANDARIG